MQPTDRQLLFGVLALQLDFISVDQFAEVCTVWATRKDRSLPDLLAERGWLKPQDLSDIDRLVARKLERHGGDVAASLREAGADARVLASLASISDEDILRSFGPTPPPRGVALIATREFEPEGRDRYTLSHVHAEGGIGRVWLARDNSLRRDVALKELRPDRSTNEAFWPRFLREARVTGQLEHPGIVPIYEVGQRPDDKAPFYTMRFIRGQTLAEAADQYHSRLNKGEAEPLELRKLLSAFVGVCNAIAYAHSRGVLHRDLKPQNVVLGAFGEVIVLDWGLAKLTSDDEVGPELVDLGSNDGVDETTMGQKLGTPAYMSPEQASGRLNLVSAKTDVYGLGAILYHILTNEPPFPAPSTKEAMDRVINDPVPRARDKAPTTAPALEAVCVKALAKKPDDRYESATALADEVQRWLADEPVKAHREPLRTRALRWARRHKTFVTAAAVFLVCATVALAGVAALIWRQQRETDRYLVRTANFASVIVEAADAAVGSADDARAAISQTGVAIVRDLRKDRPNEGRLVATLARLLQFNATAMRLGQQLVGAEAALQESVSIIQPFIEKEPENPLYRSVAASAHFNLGEMQRQLGKRREAAANHGRAIKLFGRPQRFDVNPRFNLAVAAGMLSHVYFGWKPPKEVEQASMDAAEALDDVAEDVKPPQRLMVRLLQCASLNRAALCHCHLKQPEKALPLLDKSGKILDGLSRDRFLSVPPTNRDVRNLRAQTWLSRATACEAIGNKVDALESYGKAIELWTRLAAEAPQVIEYQSMFVQALTQRADFHRRQGKRPEAESDLAAVEQRLRLRESLSVGEGRASQASVAAVRTRLAIDAKDLTVAQKHLAAARSAYTELLRTDVDNELARDELKSLETEMSKLQK
jgi:eukaryotic-like serine/threonine-protein kinase